MRDEAIETCDDGGLVDGDGCSSTCLVEGGWFCNGIDPCEDLRIFDYGVLAPGDAIPVFTSSDSLAPGETAFVQLELTEDAILDVALSIGTTSALVLVYDSTAMFGVANVVDPSFVEAVPGGTPLFVGVSTNQAVAGFTLTLATTPP